MKINHHFEEGAGIELTSRQHEIVAIVKKHAPVTGEQIAENLGVSRPTIRSDLSVLVMLGIIDAKPKVGYFLGKAVSPESLIGSRLQRMKVHEIMGRPIIVRETGTVNDAVIQMFIEHAGLLIVTDEEGLLSGMLSSKDLLKVTIGNPGAATIPIGMAMTRLPRVLMVTPEDSVLDAAHIMLEHQISGLPVVMPRESTKEDRRYEVIGRITKTSILQVLLDVANEP